MRHRCGSPRTATPTEDAKKPDVARVFRHCKFVILEFYEPKNCYESKYIILAKIDDELKYYTVDKMIGGYDIYEWFNVQYLSVSIGKGMITMDMMREYIRKYA